MFMPGLAPDALGWSVHRDFAAAVEALGHSFELLTTTSRRGAPNEKAQARRLPVGRFWRALSPLMSPILRTGSLVPAAAALAKHLRRAGRSIDVLHVEMAYPHGAAAAIAVWASGWRGLLIVTPMGEDTLVLERARYGFRRYPVPRALVDWTLRRAAYIRCISPMLEERIAVVAPDTPRRVVPLNVSERAAAAAVDTDSQRAEYRRAARNTMDADFGTSGRPTILALGRLHPFKGIETLVRAMPSIAEGVLLIAGPSLNVTSLGDTATHLLRLARELGVGERVRWVGAVTPDRSLEVLAAADVVAVPSHLESLNKVCVEAAAVGTPFVVTETTGISAWVPDDGVGIVVAPDDPVALGRALTEVLAGRWRGDSRRRAEFVRLFTPQTVAAEVVDIYRSVMAQSLDGAAGSARP